MATIESGMATATMPVARRLTRKNRMTTTARSPPCTASCCSALTADADVRRLIERDGELHAGGDAAQLGHRSR